MAKMNKYLMISDDPNVDCDDVQANWRKMAAVESATWVKSYYNEEKGQRYAIWLSPSEADLEKILTEIGIKWDAVVKVEETVPDMWGQKWEEHLAQDAAADNLGD